MSTGDQSEYIRKKMAERRITAALGSNPTFMKSGFQRWAENERPTRMGGAEKEPLAVARDGAKNVLSDVRRLGHQMFQKYYEQSGGARHYAGDDCESSSDEETGGRIMAEDIEEGARLASNVGRGMFDTSAVGKMALGELGKTIGKVAAPVLEPCETGWKDEGVTCSKTVPKKVKKIGGKVKGAIRADAPADDRVAYNLDMMDKKRKDRLGLGKNEAPKLFRPVETISSQIRPTKASLLAAEGKVMTRGSGFVDDVSNFFTGKTTAKAEAHPVFFAEAIDEGGRKKHGSGERVVGAGKKKSARGEIVKRVMREKGLSLPQASKYVKEHNLYKG